MKKLYIVIVSILSFQQIISQNYEFGIVHNSGYNFSVVAIPDFTSSGNTDISDIGFTLMLPTGNFDVTNLSLFNGRSWTSIEVTASDLTTIYSVGDGTRDAFVMNLPPGQTLLSHNSGDQIILASFDISNTPTTGNIELLPNTDSIAIGLSGAGNSFYNSNIDSTTTQDYFSEFASGMESIIFNSLGLHNDYSVEPPIKVSPNPAKTMLQIESYNQIKKVEIATINGQIVKTFEDTSGGYNIEGLSNGLYFLKIHLEGNSITKKLIKH